MATAQSRIDVHRLGLLVLTSAIALLVLSPLVWLVLRAMQVDPTRATALIVSRQTLEITAASLTLVVSVTIFSIVIGVPLAILTARSDLPYKRLFTVIVALPLVIPSYIGAFAFTAAFGPHGEIGDILGISLPEISGLVGATLIITLYTYPYVFLTTRAAVLAMDGTLVDAARTLNASNWRAFKRVTYPQIRPAIGAGALLVALYALADFGTPAFMHVEVFTSAIYWEFGAINVEYAALLALQLLAVVAVILLIEARVGADSDTAGSGKPSMPIKLRHWRYPVMAAILLLAILTLVVPVAIFGIWITRGAGTEIAHLQFQWAFAWNSIYLALLAALVASILAIPVGYFSAISSSRIGRLAERGTYVGFAVPGIVVGLALVFFGSHYLPLIYRTVPLLVFAYVVRFLPQAVGTVRSSVLQVDDRVVEAARTLDATRLEAFRRVTFPLILPGVIAGAVLVFLTTMKELPATLMLQPIGMETLVIIIWEAHESIHYSAAAIPALILILVSGLTMLVLLSQETYRLE